MKFFKSVLQKYSRYFILGPLFKFIEAVFELLLPLLVAFLLKLAFNQGFNAALNYVWLLPLLSTAGAVAALVCQHMAAKASQGSGTELRRQIVSKIQRISLENITGDGAEFYLSGATDDVNKLQTVIAMTIRLLVRAPFICIGSILMTLFIDRKIAAVMVGILPLFGFGIYFIIKFIIKHYRSQQVARDRLTRLISDTYNGLRVIKSFNGAIKQRENFASADRNLIDITSRIDFTAASINIWIVLFLQLTELGILYLGGVEISQGDMIKPQLIAVINYFNQMIMATLVVANLAILFPQGFAAAERIKRILNLPELPEPPESRAEIAKVKTSWSKNTTNGLEIINVSYTYPGAAAAALAGITFSLNPGETLGIIGGTGSGKSTLLKLMLGFYLPNSGEIKIGESVLRQHNQAAWGNMFSYVPQSGVLFKGTIADNFPDSDGVRQALETAQAGNIVNWPDDRGKEVMSAGKNFSGGQRQRLSIARALLVEAPILLMDDAFSALDFYTASLVRQALAKNYPQLTKVIAGQRIETVSKADKILVLDAGRQVGYGSHARLMCSCPLYQKIYLTQVGEARGESV